MADDDTTPNRVTVALVDAKVGEVRAKVDGLAELIKSENAATQQMIADIKPMPVAVARLEQNLKALDEREKEADDDMDRRVSAIEDSRARVFGWKVTAGVTLIAAAIGGLLGHVHIPL